jgi:hypothetical protein
MQEVCDILERLVKDGILSQYAIGGATAAGFHGEPLATRDVFVFINTKPEQLIVSLEPVFSKLAQLGFRDFEDEAVLIHGLPVQFLIASPGLESEALQDAVRIGWDHHRMRVLRPEHPAAIALSVGRPKDRARLVYLCELPDFNRDNFQDVIHRHQLADRWRQWAPALGLAP